jgi:nucleoside-diphosphate-sugar epimerase
MIEAAARVGDVVARLSPFSFTTGAVSRLVGSLVVDISRIEQAASYRPLFTVEQGMDATAAWFRCVARSGDPLTSTVPPRSH